MTHAHARTVTATFFCVSRMASGGGELGGVPDGDDDDDDDNGDGDDDDDDDDDRPRRAERQRRDLSEIPANLIGIGVRSSV